MVLNLYADDIPDLVLYKDYPNAHHASDPDMREECLHIDNLFGKGFYKEVYFDGIHIGYGDIALAKKTRIHFESDFETVEMHFTLSGDSITSSEDIQHHLNFSSNQHNIIYANNISGQIQWEQQNLKVFEINLHPAFFKRYLPEEGSLFNYFHNAIAAGRSTFLQKHNNLINLEMLQIIQEIINCDRKGIFKRMFLEAKVIELLLLQLEQMNSGNSLHSSLKKSDIEKIYAVREFILEHIDQTYSLTDLARIVGTNDFLLKKGFKELFGTTVFGFWNDTKMEQAHKMIREQHMNISEVADAVGYKNPQHFTVAFKRRFGIAPSHLKR
ncbi:helix-turn-helix transcriptional regulator [Sphingobacterium spiritivorum]|uniref:helix-turn-helix transcriptional regulator n=1 Tax=Sphingobacterium spiritivorum TaxID=258 RepID=UPI003DA2162A